MLRLFLFIAVLLALDVYAFQAVRHVTRPYPEWQRFWFTAWWLVSLACYAVIVVAQFTDWHMWPKAFRTYSFALVFIVFVSKLFIDAFLVVDDLARLFRYAGSYLVPSTRGAAGGLRISRLDFLVRAGLVAGAIPFVSLIYGMVSGVDDFRVRRIRLRHRGLATAFRNFRIVQVSDIHTGSYHSDKPLKKAVGMINALEPDVVFFTGDLVNNRHQEALPFVPLLQSIRAPHGVFSILGNHDYGDYTRWPSEEAKQENLSKLKALHGTLGWNLLIDGHAYIRRGDDRLAVVGVQNWSGRAGFQRYGDLDKAVRGVEYGSFNILLSHDPSHWDAQVRGNHPGLHLTLSGHTHGMQFGVEIPGFRWSPAQYFYRQWAGLYGAPDQHLYVNRGLGYIGYPGRVGILPEITVIELEPA